MEPTFYVNTYEGKNDDEIISACLRDASFYEKKTVVFSGRDYEINNAVLVESGMTIIIDGCTIRQRNRAFDNVFRGANIHLDPDNPMNPAVKLERLQNIKIIGRNNAVIEGCSINRNGYHPVLGEEQEMTGDYWGFLTYQILFVMTENLEIAGLCLKKTRGWAVTLDLCEHFSLHDMQIYSKVKNGDGIHLLSGCCHGVIQRIKGVTSDDLIAVQAGFRLDEFPSENYLAPFYPSRCEYEKRSVRELDCHDIIIRDIFCGGEMHGIILLALNDTCIYDICMENIEDIERGKRYFATVFLYTGVYGAPGMLKDIVVRRVSSLADTAFVSNTSITNLLLSEITSKNENGRLYGTFRGK